MANAVLHGSRVIGIAGWETGTFLLIEMMQTRGLTSWVKAVFTLDSSDPVTSVLGIPVVPVSALSETELDVLVVASDEDKEGVLKTCLPFVRGLPRVIVGGYGHFKFRDAAFRELQAGLLVPSFANGYPYTLTHLYQCLKNAARLELAGVVAEFGMFKGGTTMFLSRAIEHFGCMWPVIGFDTFEGFPPRRSILDMYDHPDCVFSDLPAVKRYFEGRQVEIVSGDIAQTCHRLDREDIVLSFMDTDNYTPAASAIDVIRERTVVGGAIVFDHFTGVDRFRYTLGERMAGMVLLEDPRYFHLHDTGVFLRQK